MSCICLRRACRQGLEEDGTVTRCHLTFSVSLPSCCAAIKAADMSPKGGRETNKEREGLRAVSDGHLDSAGGGRHVSPQGWIMSRGRCKTEKCDTCGINGKFFTNNGKAIPGRPDADKKEPAFRIKRVLWGGKRSKII